MWLTWVAGFIIGAQLVILVSMLGTLRTMGMILREHGLHLAAVNEVTTIHQHHINMLSERLVKSDSARGASDCGVSHIRIVGDNDD